MASNTEKLVKTTIECLSDTRTDQSGAMNSILDEADRNDYLQVYLWWFVLTYLYNRAGRYRLGVVHTDNQEYIMKRCHEMCQAVLDEEYRTLTKSIPVSGSGLSGPDIRTDINLI